MNILKHSWMILLMLIGVANTGFSGTLILSESVSVNESTLQSITYRDSADFPLAHTIETHTIEIPPALAVNLVGQVVKVGNHSDQVLELKTIHLRGDHLVVVGQRLVSRSIDKQLRPSFWLQEVWWTFPRFNMANSWDVQSLQRELERLGIKIKPKPAKPKPTQQLSG